MKTLSDEKNKLKWRLIATDQLQWADWGEDTVVFNSLSADTHLLNCMTLDVLLALSKEPMSTDQLMDKLSHQWLQPLEQIAKPISSLIHNLDCLGLIEPEFT